MHNTRKTSPTLLILRLSLLVLSIAVTVAGCVSDGSPPLARNLPPAPSRLMKATAIPQLDSQCYFPWTGITGCDGKDARAMLRLTTSSLVENRARLTASAGWYESVRKSYSGK